MVSTPVLVLAVVVAGCGPAPVPAPVAPAPQPTDPQATSPSHRETVGPDDPVDPAAVARAAVLFASCVADDQPHSTATSLYGGRPYERGWLMDLREELLCLASSTDGCEAVRRCLGIDARR